MVKTAPIRPAVATSPYENAILAAFEDLDLARERARQTRSQLQRELTHIAELQQVIASLIDVLPHGHRERYLERLRDLQVRAEASTRGGPVFDNLVQLFKRDSRREWTAADIQMELSRAGIPSDSKAVSNVLAYMARTGKIRRVARGQYLVVGSAAFSSADEVSGAEWGQTRVSEHDV